MVLRLGSQGEEVKAVQGLLNATGERLKVDGVYGTKTKDAVERLQQQSSLNITGIYDPLSAQALQLLAGKRRAVPPAPMTPLPPSPQSEVVEVPDKELMEAALKHCETSLSQAEAVVPTTMPPVPPATIEVPADGGGMASVPSETVTDGGATAPMPPKIEGKRKRRRK